MKYFTKFNTEQEFEDAALSYPNCSYIAQTDRLVVEMEQPTPPPPPATNALCFTALEANSTVNFHISSSIQFESSADGVNWASFSGGEVSLPNAGDMVYFRNSSDVQVNLNNSPYGRPHYFSGTGAVKVSGNLMTLSKKDGDVTTLQDYEYRQMFMDFSALVDAKDLEIGATSIGYDCFGGTLEKTGITETPVLMLTDCVYTDCQYMFNECTSLRKINSINYAFHMFVNNCTSLEEIRWKGGSGSLSNMNIPSSTSGICYVQHGVTVSGLPSGWTVVEED